MGRIEKTVFISYRRTNFYTALAVYQDLTAHGYDAFFDYQSIDSGNFSNVILENIESHAHFVVVLSPSALERCSQPGDWLRREIENAIELKRNIVPLMMEGFDFGSPITIQALSGNLATLNTYNGLRLYADYFFDAMEKLRTRFLSVALEDVRSREVSAETRLASKTTKSLAKEAPQVESQQLTAEQWFERAYTLQEAKNFEEAIRCYTEALRLEPDMDSAHNNLGVLLSDLKRNDEAEAAYRKAIELNPADDTAYSNLGNLLRELKHNDEAEAAYRKAIELNPAYDKAYYNLGLRLSDLKRNDEAEAAYRKAIELNPAYDKAYYNLGNLLRELKHNDEAKAAYRKAIELNPNYAMPTIAWRVWNALTEILKAHLKI
jgi:tetratricopeptide (TPR) repeat protein